MAIKFRHKYLKNVLTKLFEKMDERIIYEESEKKYMVNALIITLSMIFINLTKKECDFMEKRKLGEMEVKRIS